MNLIKMLSGILTITAALTVQVHAALCEASDVVELIKSPQPPGAAKDLVTSPRVTFLGGRVIVMEYDSVYDVHVRPDPTNYPNMRVQPGGFDQDRILTDLTNVIHPEAFGFVLMYSIPEVPGWINSGGNRSAPLAKNIGFLNSQSGQSWSPPGWNKLRACPHMNSVEFIDRPSGSLTNYGGALTVFHEAFHHWGPNITRNSSVGPREWVPGNPLAWLAQCCYHWAWNFSDPGLPGIMYSGPTSASFNAFDLYLMGLLGYNEASAFSYTIYELLNGMQPPASQTNLYHQLRVDDLIYALSLSGTNYYEGDGRRIPDTDPSVTNLQVLIVVLKGKDELLTARHVDLLLGMAADIPNAWQAATWGRSQMRARVNPRKSSMFLSFSDPSGDATGRGDVTRFTMNFDTATGTYEIRLTASPTNLFQGSFRVNINLYNPDLDPANCNWSMFGDTMNDLDIPVPTNTVVLTGSQYCLRFWKAGDRVAISGPDPLGLPGCLSVGGFGSGIMDLPIVYPYKYDNIATGQYGVIDVSAGPPALSIRAAHPQIELGWDSAINVQYQVQYRPTLTGGNWISLGPPVRGNGSRMYANDSIALGNATRYYRVVPLP